ncbi:hypothetical protein R1flu_014791 [Riccia fluitans]|uniref:Mediator of RNA polymerase II transcription subunit 16 n=1 Tax=Riccia fluitans TaxID=41844 RepID=A0ABD1YHH8_9MARC
MNMLGEADEARNMEGLDEEEEEEERNVVAMIKLHLAPYPFHQKINIAELFRFSSAIAWCPRTNIVACATETCARDPGTSQQPAFWIPVHVVDPERPSEHAVFNVTADSPVDAVQSMEWSSLSCPQALMICNTSGRVTIWSQPTQGPPSVACSINCWRCEYEWQQEQYVSVKWLAGPSPYRWSPTASTSAGASSKSFEERFLAHMPRPTARWPNFLCICVVLFSGSVQLRWRQWPPQNFGPVKWHATNKAVLGAGPSGVFCADAIITDSGNLHVVGAPVGHPSTLVVWEVSPWVLNPAGASQQAVKYTLGGQSPLAFGPTSWPGVSPLAAYLMSWQEQAGVDVKTSQSQGQPESDEKAGPMLYCSPVSNLSAYVTPEASTLSTWGSGVAAVAFDPSRGGNALVTVICEGYFITPEAPDDGPTMTGWRFQRWESTRQQVAIHPLFESQSAGYPPSSQPMVTSWTAVTNKTMSPRGNFNPMLGGFVTSEPARRKTEMLVARERPKNPRIIARISFANHGGEWALSLATGEVMIYSGTSVTPLETFVVKASTLLPPSVAFSPTSCCVASVWHDKKADCSLLKIWCLDPPAPASPQGGSANSLTWERHIADRFWWSLVTGVDWWDTVACTEYVTESGDVTVARVAAVLDADFHALSSIAYRQHYSVALDQIKSRMLEGFDAGDSRALVLDMQARLTLDVLGKGIESCLVSPATLIAEPWVTGAAEQMQSLGADALAVDPNLLPNVQAYVDAILDLASHFLTRLRRYANFCRQLASHGGANLAANAANRPGVNASNGGPLPGQTGQGPGGQAGAAGNGTATGVQWLQGAVAKLTSTGDGTGTNSSSTGLQAHALGVGSTTFPGIPGVRLIGDTQFLHRLCQLLFFCLFFRKRQLSRHVAAASTARLAAADASAAAPKGVNGLVGKTEDSNTSGNTVTRSVTGAPVVKNEDGTTRPAALTKAEEAQLVKTFRAGTGNAGQGYTSDEVKYLFLVLVELCKRTASSPRPVPKSQVGTSNPVMRLHYVDGLCQVAPEVLEASLGPHMQLLPRPRGADAAGLLMKELELHAPAEEWTRRSTSFGPYHTGYQNEIMDMDEEDQYLTDFWPRKRRITERDAAFGFRTAIGLGSFAGFMGSRRDIVTALWKTAQHGHWHKCMRCGRKTTSLTPPNLKLMSSEAIPTTREAWWTGRWRFKCPMCGGRWARML